MITSYDPLASFVAISQQPYASQHITLGNFVTEIYI